MTKKQRPQLNSSFIDSDALSIVEKLQSKGFTTYLVGGCVRDLLLGIQPKDYDIATDAQPRDVKRNIHNSFIIGKRFRLVLVKRGTIQYEVATFRRDIREDEDPDDLPEGDNIFGTPQEDANRRDFTINALFYDPIKEELIDYSKGQSDLNSGVIRMIGDPDKRFIEDSIRILRAIRLAHKIRFCLEHDLKKSIKSQAEALATSALPRRREEFLKFLRLPEPLLAFIDAYDLGVLKYTMPSLHKILDDENLHEVFVGHFNHFHKHSKEKTNTELFLPLVLAYIRTVIEPDIDKALKSKTLLENPELLQLMKFELGMFNYEQMHIAKALQLQSSLKKVEEFARRGEKRQISLLRQESFSMALEIAEWDFTLSAEESLFWKSRYDTLRPLIASEEAQMRKKKKKRRPRRRKKA